VRPSGGLANRLLGVTSAWVLARRFKLPLAMLWQPSMCRADHQWSDLFQNEIETIDRPEYEAAVTERIPLASDWFKVTSLDDPDTSLRRIREEGVIHDDGYYDLLAKLGSRGVRGCRRLRRKVYRALRPVSSIAKERNEFVKRSFRKRNVIGLHIRRGDAKLRPDREQYAPSTDAAFERVIEERPRHTSTSPLTTALLSSASANATASESSPTSSRGSKRVSASPSRTSERRSSKC